MENGGRAGVQHLKQSAGDVAQQVQDRVEEMRGYAEDAGEWVRRFARQRPVAAVAIAAGLGFLVGRLLSRT